MFQYSMSSRALVVKIIPNKQAEFFLQEVEPFFITPTVILALLAPTHVAAPMNGVAGS